MDNNFTAYGEELKWVKMFKYLGRLLSYGNNDTQVAYSNLKKARKCWGRLQRILKAENASPWVCGKFYKAIVQAILLFKPSSISDTMPRRLSPTGSPAYGI